MVGTSCVAFRLAILITLVHFLRVPVYSCIPHKHICNAVFHARRDASPFSKAVFACCAALAQLRGQHPGAARLHVRPVAAVPQPRGARQRPHRRRPVDGCCARLHAAVLPVRRLLGALRRHGGGAGGAGRLDALRRAALVVASPQQGEATRFCLLFRLLTEATV